MSFGERRFELLEAVSGAVMPLIAEEQYPDSLRTLIRSLGGKQRDWKECEPEANCNRGEGQQFRNHVNAK